ncbi:MAG: PEP-CTERM sorting domain-containing protein [Candidatus Eisenbacteria bacterium]|nr:PEP-CTERM sorting domain-containing protein [Candidatus Eisenbacteria bacterium]
MRTRRLLGALALVAILAIPSVSAAYFGSLLSTDGGIQGTGNWIVTGPTMFEWVVTQNMDNSWHYSYVFGHPSGETSHFILEVSSNFTENDIFNLQGDIGAGGFELKTHSAGGGANPTMPEDMYGIKFEGTTGEVTSFEFDSWRVPVWKDFYAVDGTAGGHGPNAAWNTGFTSGDVDPLDAASDGSLNYHILAPDSQTPPVPEPTTLMLLGSGLLGSIAVFRRRRK